MYSDAEHLHAIALYFNFGRNITYFIRELGYLSEGNLL